jgi:GTP pyrophosphokinase
VQSFLSDAILHNGQTVKTHDGQRGRAFERFGLYGPKGYLASHRARSKVKAWSNAIDTPIEKDAKGTEKELKNYGKN